MAHQWVTFAPIYVNPDKNKQDWIIIESAINWLLIRLIIHLSVYHSLHKSGYIFASYIVGLYRTFSARRPLVIAQGPEEICLSLEHQNRSKTSEKWVILITLQFRYTFYRLQTNRLRARKIGLQYTLLGTSCLGCPSGDVQCASEDMACGYWFSKWRTTKSIWVR